MTMAGLLTISWSVQRDKLPSQSGGGPGGCTTARSGRAVVTAGARTTGGEYRFWNEPETMLALRPNGAAVDLTCVTQPLAAVPFTSNTPAPWAKRSSLATGGLHQDQVV